MKNTLKNRLKKKKYFLIAEIGNNHGGDINKAKNLIIAAKKSGADAVKFQFTNPDGLVSPNEKKRFQQLKNISLSFDQLNSLKKFSKKKKIEFFVSIFDINYVEKFNKLQNIFKIASGDNNYIDLINKILNLKKSTIISTGLLDEKNFHKLKNFLMKKCNKKFIKNDLCLMHCVSSYPSKNEILNLSFIEKLKNNPFITGYSDHSEGIDACVYAYLLGAKIIEKHFTLLNDKKNSFRDHKLSATPNELRQLKSKLDQINLMKGNGIKKIEIGEKKELVKSRRSLFTKKNIECGESLSDDKLVFLRPGGGIPPSNYKYLGKKLKINLKKNQKILARYIKK